VLPNGHHEVDGKVFDSYFVLPANGRDGGAPLGSFEEALESGLLIPGSSDSAPEIPQSLPPAIEPPAVEPPAIPGFSAACSDLRLNATIAPTQAHRQTSPNVCRWAFSMPYQSPYFHSVAFAVHFPLGHNTKKVALQTFQSSHVHHSHHSC
jgi:hypothetical protein